MDVRCEKCQTEYELDEARLKPGGVTVKCTNCGHMFKIRKRSATNVGAPVASSEKPTQVAKPPSAHAPAPAPAPPVVRTPPPAEPSPRDSATFDEPTRTGDGPADERQWLIRLENGEQKSCRELAVLQQWIIGGVVTREALISRTGKTWKRIGDITELAQYFAIGDEARTKRQERTTTPSKPHTMLGVGSGMAPSAAGGTILPDDDTDVRTTGSYRTREATPPPPPPRAPAPAPANEDALATTQPAPSPNVTRRPTTQPPPVPPKKEPERAKGPSVPAGNRATAMWATDGKAPGAVDESGPAGPLGGKLKVETEPAFAGRVRVEPGESTAFRGGGKVTFEEDEEVMPPRKGSKAGWIMLVVLLLVGGGAAAAYFLVFKDKGKDAQQQAAVPSDAAAVAQAADAGAAAPPPTTIDAAAAPVAGPLELARAELAGDREAKLREALASISTVKDPGADALRAYLTASIAQQLLDRAQVTADKAEADKLKKEAKTVITDALGPAQKAVQAAPDDVTANLAMAAVLRVQGKSARDLKKYLDAAKAKATPELQGDVALAEALVLQRDGKLADAKTLLDPVQAGDDVRVPLRRALIAYAQNKPDEAKPLVDNVLTLAPDHVTAKALADRLQTTVAKTDPLPPEDNPPTNSGSGSGSGTTKPPTNPTNTTTTPVAAPGDSYDKLLAKANTLAERNCTQAMDLFAKALEQKPNGVEALTGMGYCHIDAKQFSAAYSKFRAALAVSPRFEPALWGIAETYLQQGRKEQALEAVKAYIEAHGETPKAKKALERLQPAGDAPSNGGSSTPPPASDPTPAPAPAPAPTPPPTEGAGSGSG